MRCFFLKYDPEKSEKVDTRREDRVNCPSVGLRMNLIPTTLFLKPKKEMLIFERLFEGKSFVGWT